MESWSRTAWLRTRGGAWLGFLTAAGVVIAIPSRCCGASPSIAAADDYSRSWPLQATWFNEPEDKCAALIAHAGAQNVTLRLRRVGWRSAARGIDFRL